MKTLLDKFRLAKEGDKTTVQAFFYVMVAVIVLSILWSVLSSTIFKPKYERPHAVATSPMVPIANSFNGAMTGATNLMEIMDIKASIDSLMIKETLTKSDSLQLMSALRRLEILHKNSK